MADLKTWLEQELRRLPGRSKLAEAIRYALGRWMALCVYLDDGRVEMDTNVVERCMAGCPGQKEQSFCRFGRRRPSLGSNRLAGGNL